MAELKRAETAALWHAVEALAWQCRVMKDIVPPLSQESQDAEWERLRLARAALRKVNAIRRAESSGGVEGK
jgi:hypothetical protein